MGSVTPGVLALGFVAVRVKAWVTVPLRSTFSTGASGLVKVTTGSGVATTVKLTAGLQSPTAPRLSMARAFTGTPPVTVAGKACIWFAPPATTSPLPKSHS